VEKRSLRPGQLTGSEGNWERGSLIVVHRRGKGLGDYLLKSSQKGRQNEKKTDYRCDPQNSKKWMGVKRKEGAKTSR